MRMCTRVFGGLFVQADAGLYHQSSPLVEKQLSFERDLVSEAGPISSMTARASRTQCRG